MDTLSLPSIQTTHVRPDAWRSMLAVRQESRFYTLLESMTESDKNALSAALAPYKETSPMARYLQERLRAGDSSLWFNIPEDLMKDLKTRYDPEHMTSDDLYALLDELVENNVITEEEKQRLWTIPVMEGCMDTEYAGLFGRTESGKLMDAVGQDIESMGMQLSWTLGSNYVEGAIRRGEDPQKWAIKSADWLNGQMKLWNLLQQLGA